jgi:hypothetical protein
MLPQTSGLFAGHIQSKYAKDRFTYSAFMDKGDGEHRNMMITWERR